MITISSLKIPDLEDAYAIEQRAYEFPWSRNIFFSCLNEGYLNFCLDIKGKVVAFIITLVIKNEATLLNIAVDPVFHRCGMGKAILKHTIRALNDLRTFTMWLEVRVSNTAAIALYENLGFNKVTIRHNYYPTTKGYEDAIVMNLTLWQGVHK